jgi:hypothetical protein
LTKEDRKYSDQNNIRQKQPRQGRGASEDHLTEKTQAWSTEMEGVRRRWNWRRSADAMASDEGSWASKHAQASERVAA